MEKDRLISVGVVVNIYECIHVNTYGLLADVCEHLVEHALRVVCMSLRVASSCQYMCLRAYELIRFT